MTNLETVQDAVTENQDSGQEMDQNSGQNSELDQSNHDSGDSVGASGDESNHVPAEDSLDGQENQAEQTVKASGAGVDSSKNEGKSTDALALDERIAKKLAVIQEVLANREGLVQKGAAEKINNAYRNQWQEEANELFHLAVMLRARQRRIATPSTRKRDRIA